MIPLCVVIAIGEIAGLVAVYSVMRAGRQEKELYEMLGKAIDKSKEIIPDSRDLDRHQDTDKDLSWQRIEEKRIAKAKERA